MADLESFRKETAQWLEANCPASMRTPLDNEEEVVWGGRNAVFVNPDSKQWLEAMAEKGWTVPAWPKEYGGAGLALEEVKVLNQELQHIHARPPLISFGIWMLGPVLLEFANEEQKRTHLPKIARGEIRWCQGYSEPGAGSDLAGLQTRAEDKGDHYLINGQKIWTSFADQADWIFCLVRTDNSKKHDGISFLLFDMASKGVETKPIKLISGASPFCETFFTNVKVPKENLVYELNKGWTVAKKLLQFERESISNFGGTRGGGPFALDQLAKEYLGENQGKIADPVLREHIAQFNMDGTTFALTLRRLQEEAKTGPTPATSIMKYYGGEHNKRRYELFLDVMGVKALGWENDPLAENEPNTNLDTNRNRLPAKANSIDGEPFSENELDTTRKWLRSKGNSIEGGTSEVQLNIIAKRVLGLPD